MNYEVNLEAKQLIGLLPDLKKNLCWITICRSFVKVLLFYLYLNTFVSYNFIENFPLENLDCLPPEQQPVKSGFTQLR